jgi:hypothetical protein
MARFRIPGIFTVLVRMVGMRARNLASEKLLKSASSVERVESGKKFHISGR